MPCLEHLQEFQPVQFPGTNNVAQHQVDPSIPRNRQPLMARSGLDGPPPAKLSKNCLDQLPDQFLVVDDQDRPSLPPASLSFNSPPALGAPWRTPPPAEIARNELRLFWRTPFDHLISWFLSPCLAERHPPALATDGCGPPAPGIPRLGHPVASAARAPAALQALAAPEIAVRTIVAVATHRTAVLAFVDTLAVRASLPMACFTLTTHMCSFLFLFSSNQPTIPNPNRPHLPRPFSATH